MFLRKLVTWGVWSWRALAACDAGGLLGPTLVLEAVALLILAGVLLARTGARLSGRFDELFPAYTEQVAAAEAAAAAREKSKVK